MSPAAKRVNLRDIAEVSGVSIQTVSRVVRGIDVVAEPTRSRVLAAVQQLNYQPNLAARSLSAHRTGSVHVVDAVPLYHGYLAAFVEICQRLSALELHTSITVLRNASNAPTLQDLVPVSADGVIILGGAATTPAWVSTISERFPTVYVGHSVVPPPVISVAVDSRAGAIAATEHLLKRGAKRIAHVAGPQDWADAVARLAGYVETCERIGVEPLILESGSWDAPSAAPLMDNLPDEIDAIFAANDQLALGCMTALQRSGRTVPGDVRIVGFDDIVGAGSFLPALTTVRQDFSGLGENSVRQLAALMAGQPAHNVVLTPQLIVRDSS